MRMMRDGRDFFTFSRFFGFGARSCAQTCRGVDGQMKGWPVGEAWLLSVFFAQTLDRMLKISGWFACRVRLFTSQAMRVQHRAGDRVVRLAVVGVAEDRMAEVGEGDADLVEEAGAQFDFEQCGVIEDFEWAISQAAQSAFAAGDADLGGAVLGDFEGQRDAVAGVDLTGDQGVIDFSRAVFAEVFAEALPDGWVKGEQERAGRADVEAVDDAAAQAGLADADDFGIASDDGVEHRVVLIGLQGMDRNARGFIDDDPAVALREFHERQARRRNGLLVFGSVKRIDRDPLPSRQRAALPRLADGSPVHRDRPAIEQPLDLGA